jgi:Rrf2 family protein
VDISAKADYAVRSLLVLASRDPERVKADQIAEEQDMPRGFVESILGDLRRAGFVRSHRGVVGGYSLARPATEITIGSVIRAIDGPLAQVRGWRPHEAKYDGVAEHLPTMWIAVRASLRRVLDETTVHQLLTGRLPAHVRRMAETGDAWLPR